jgi:glutamate racemase
VSTPALPSLLQPSPFILSPFIGVFDSGVGGLSVLRHICALLPQEHLLYLADQAHVPYGPRSLAEIHRFSEGITHFLLAQGAKLIVVACNTASGAALTHLRQSFPDVPFVGMEPAVKPAAEQTRSGQVGVLATTSTFESRRYGALMARFARNVTVYEDPCRGLVEQIEAGQVDTPQTEALLRRTLEPMLAAGVDTVVLGCTHYPFVAPVIDRIVGPAVTLIDPAPAVARQTVRLLSQHGLLAAPEQVGQARLFTTGDVERLAELVTRLLGYPLPVESAVWQGDLLTVRPS